MWSSTRCVTYGQTKTVTERPYTKVVPNLLDADPQYHSRGPMNARSFTVSLSALRFFCSYLHKQN